MPERASISPPKARLLVVDDHPLYLQGLKDFLAAQPDLAVCASADSCATALRAAAQHKPDVVILDLRLGDSDGMSIIPDLRAMPHAPRVLVLSQRDETALAGAVLRAGAHGYIMKEEATEELLVAVRTVLRGEIYASRRISGRILRRFYDGIPDGDISGKLSDRELQVFQFIGAGLSNHEIAGKLHLSVKTVETHRENMKHKLGLPDAAALARVAQDWLDASDR